ncbi:MAG: hypothetical protein WBA89_24810 [Microcoleus sp.]
MVLPILEIKNWELGMGNWEWGMGHWEWGIVGCAAAFSVEFVCDKSQKKSGAVKR